MVVLRSHSCSIQVWDKVRIYYYRGSDNDVIEVDILETVTGDSLTINKYPDFGVDSRFQQVNRAVTALPPQIP